MTAVLTAERLRVAVGRRLGWARAYGASLIVSDLVMTTVAAIVALRVRFGGDEAYVRVRGVPYAWLTFLFPLLWVLALGVTGAYERRYLGLGSDEFKRVLNAGIGVTAGVSFIAFVGRIPIARGYVGLLLPGATLLTLLGRYAVRKAVHRARRRGRCCHRVLVVGAPADAAELVLGLRREPYAGFMPVAACVTGQVQNLPLSGEPVPVLGTVADVRTAVQRAGADTVAVTASPGLGAASLRRLGWELEGARVDLLVAPALTNIAGPRIHVRPVSGLPLLHVEEPDLSGSGQLVKAVFDRTVAVVGLVLLSPLLVAIALAVRANSPGPAIFRQERVGRDGRVFLVWKFRTMHTEAESRLAALLSQNHCDGLLFKLREDPRVTKVGRLLRRYSLDELPQLVNVLLGQMSLVGPRPLPVKFVQDGDDVRRRLLVRPGITGLWQISGRSNLSWEETVRLDLYYVENWSLVFDFMILWKTFFAVLRGHGAY